MTGPRIAPAVFLALILASSASSAAQEAAEDPERDDRIGLADLAAYRAALSGRPTADDARPSDPPARVGFRDLWERPEAYRGRRVTIGGRLERTFRQGAVGSFPPLVESWIFSAAGDPFCIVYPQPEATGRGGPTGESLDGSAEDRTRGIRAGTPGGPRPGRMVRFTGTYLKTVRYAARNGERLAPLIVGDRPPEPRPAGEVDGESVTPSSAAGEVLRAIGGGDQDRRPGRNRDSWAAGSWALGLAMAAMAALVIAGQYLRGAQVRRRAARRRRLSETDLPDPPLHFVDSPPEASS
jgi:hypothetical protein